MRILVHKATHMLSCKEVTQLNSQRFDRRLTLGDRFKIMLHLRVCEACNRVLAQLIFMEKALERYRAGPPTSANGKTRKPVSEK